MALLYQIPVDPLSCKAIFPSKTGNSSTLAVNPVLPLQARLFALFFATASLWFRPFLLSLRGRIFVSEAVSPFCSDKRVSLRASFFVLRSSLRDSSPLRGFGMTDEGCHCEVVFSFPKQPQPLDCFGPSPLAMTGQKSHCELVVSLAKQSCFLWS